MKKYINLSILFSLFSFGYFINLEKFDYVYAATKILNKYTLTITGVQGKTNKTKCYAFSDIKINDTILKYDKNDILSSESCFHPQKDQILKNISSYTNDTYQQNKMLLAFCIYYELQDPNNTNNTENQKFKIHTLPIEQVNHSELLFNYSDLNEFLIAGTAFTIFESELIEKIIDRNLNIRNRFNENFRLYTKIYYYISSHSFNVSGNAIILPFIDICNIVPYYLTKANLNFTNSSIVEEEGNKIIVKAARNFQQSEQYLFSYNISLDNDLLMLKQGIFIHDNKYDKYIINKKFSFEHNYETDELFHTLKNHNLDPSLFQYRKTNLGYDAWFKFELEAEKANDYLYRFGIIYYDWWKNISRSNNSEYKHFEKQAMTLILRMCYDELNEIRNRMEVDFDEYLLKTQEDNNITELNKKLRKFNMEKVHLLNKNIKYMYNNLVALNYNEIKKKKDLYINIEPNNDSEL